MSAFDLQTIVGRNENILWRGKPDFKCFILESIFNPMLPFALIWALFDAFFIGSSLRAGTDSTFAAILVPFMLLHLMPVWIYLGGVIFSFLKYKHTQYIITDRGLYVSGGTFTCNYEMKPFAEIAHINIHRGIFDQLLGVGDVVSVCGHGGYNSRDSHSAHGGMTICDIRDYQQVYQMLADLQTSIYADTMYPNDLRPPENHGYQTKYIPPYR